MVIENQEKIVELKEEEKIEAYNRYWNDENYTFEINNQKFTLKEYTDYLIKEEKKYFNKMKKFNKEVIPDGKFILFINSAVGGVVDSEEKKYVDSENWAKMIETETGYSDTRPEEFQAQNMRRRLGFEKDDQRFRIWNTYTEEVPKDMENCVGVVLSGSKINLFKEKNKKHIEIAQNIEDFLKKEPITKIPKLGICFGAQMLAKMHGAKIKYVTNEEGNPKMISGLKRLFVKIESDILPELKKEQSFKIATNHEQMIDPESIQEGTKIIANNHTCPEILIHEKDGVISIGLQSHIEVGPKRLATSIEMKTEPEPPHNILKEFSPELMPIVFRNFIRIAGEYANKN